MLAVLDTPELIKATQEMRETKKLKTKKSIIIITNDAREEMSLL